MENKSPKKSQKTAVRQSCLQLVRFQALTLLKRGSAQVFSQEF